MDPPNAAPIVPAGADVWEPGLVRMGADGSRAIVWLSGEHDISTVAVLTAALDQVVARGADVVIDLAEIEFMDASTIDAIVRCRRLLAEEGRRLSLRGPQRVARRVIGVCGLASLIEDPGGTPAAAEAHSAIETWVQIPSRRRIDSHPSRRGEDVGDADGPPRRGLSFDEAHLDR